MLDTERLLLREICKDDIDAIHAYRSDPAVALMTGFDPQTVEQTHAFLSLAIESQQANPRTVYIFGVEEKSSNRQGDPQGALIGNGTLRIRNSQLREADIAYVLGRDHWGQGYGTEIAARLLTLAFKELKLHRVYATCRADNTTSAHVLEKIGIRKEAHFREDTYKQDRWWDTLLYALLDHEWHKRAGIRATQNSQVE